MSHHSFSRQFQHSRYESHNDSFYGGYNEANWSRCWNHQPPNASTPQYRLNGKYLVLAVP
jgi:hypothetical protein